MTRRHAPLALALLWTCAGCARPPASAPWRDGDPTIVAQPPGARGFLTVETQKAGYPNEGEQPHERFYVYDVSGRYLDWFNNDRFLPIELPPGKYVVVSRYSGRNKRVQVEIKDGCSASIRLRDFERAPAAD